MDYALKKTLKASEQDREDVKIAREEWKNKQKDFDTTHLVFIDETGAKTNMTRLYGRAMLGQRCFDSAPDGRWERTTLLSALRVTGQTQSLVFEGALDTKMYEAYMEKFLLPTLNPGDIVIADNLNVHKSENVRRMVEGVGASYLPLPPYSPDLNPIEKMWSKIKQYLRGIKARTQESLEAAIGCALDTITSEDAQGWFASCGYGLGS